MTTVFTLVDRGGEGSLLKRTHFAHTFFVLNQEWDQALSDDILSVTQPNLNCSLNSALVFVSRQPGLLLTVQKVESKKRRLGTRGGLGIRIQLVTEYCMPNA